MLKSPKTGLTDLRQAELVTLAVYLAGGAAKAVDTEDAAIKAHQMAPGRLCWRKYPEQINLELVRVFLSDAKKPANGLLTGSGKTGWRLTLKGMRWIESTGRLAIGQDHSRKREVVKSGSVDEQRFRRERNRVLGSTAWGNWAGDKAAITRKQAEEVFRIDSYAVGDLRTTKITRLLDTFRDDGEILPFLQSLSQLLEKEGSEE
jgi:hypothetical protein